MSDSIYQDIFSDWSSVQEEFQMQDPEPHKVLFARYSYEDYSGDADVAWLTEDGLIGHAGGSHCSCYGLEGQWAPELYPDAIALDMLKRSDDAFGQAGPAIRAALT